ncbi:GNAT family N-acetyltransferase [Desulfosporosinus sp. SB140]|uniref:GNAT family N-acetyltransferase n=1 Tax=Desulfosporosinus paludis TaxID=3115649 RepID=UPI00388EDA19
MKWDFEDYTIETDKTLISANRIKEFLLNSYWAKDRSIEVIEKSIKNSFCYGVYHDKELVGFARVVSDYATMFWIGDVYIDKNHRGKGLGKKLIECIIETKEFENLSGILSTRDAHGLYEQFGFERVESKFMARAPLRITDARDR